MVDNLIDQMTITTLERMALETIMSKWVEDGEEKSEVTNRWTITISANDTYNPPSLWVAAIVDNKLPSPLVSIEQQLCLGVGGNITTALFRCLEQLKEKGTLP